jgi:hypothetical protein
MQVINTADGFAGKLNKIALGDPGARGWSAGTP